MPYTDLRKGRFSQTGLVYHITTATKNRAPYFESLGNGRKVVQQFMALQDQGMAETLCYVLMPDHLHWLMVLQSGTLPETMRILKGRSARAIGKPIWQANYHVPLRANLVSRIGDYSLWDAVWLEYTLSG